MFIRNIGTVGRHFIRIKHSAQPTWANGQVRKLYAYDVPKTFYPKACQSEMGIAARWVCQKGMLRRFVAVSVQKGPPDVRKTRLFWLKTEDRDVQSLKEVKIGVRNTVKNLLLPHWCKKYTQSNGRRLCRKTLFRSFQSASLINRST